MMKRVYIAENAAMAWHVRNVLEGEGITATVKNDDLYSVSGEVPFMECWPEVWINNKLDYDRAKRLIGEILKAPKQDSQTADGDSPWACKNCGESSAGNFDICWKCQAPRSEET